MGLTRSRAQRLAKPMIARATAGGHGQGARQPVLRTARTAPGDHHRMTRQSALLRRDLPRRGRRVDEVGGELRVARLGVLHRLLLHRAVAADAVGQRQQFDRGVER